jgi:hypothetical protein
MDGYTGFHWLVEVLKQNDKFFYKYVRIDFNVVLF